MYGNTYGVITGKCACGDVHYGKDLFKTLVICLGTDLTVEQKFKSSF